MASSAPEQQHHLPNPYGATAAPPPTPSTQPKLLSTSEAADALSCLLHRLPPNLTLSLPTRRLSPTSNTITAAVPPVSLSDPTPTFHSNLLSACSPHCFFQLIHHSIPSQLVLSAESESRSLFNLSEDEKETYFPKNWPLGYDADDDDDESMTTGRSFCLDSVCSSESSELNLTSLREFTREMEKLGLALIEALSCALGFDNPANVDSTRLCSLMWVSEVSSSNKSGLPSRMYPYVVGLQYQIRSQKYSLLSDSGWVSVSPEVDSVMVTVGDIAQVWSNGKLNKVRGKPLPNLVDGNNPPCCLSMTLLVTLPIASSVSPLLPNPASSAGGPGSEVSREEEDDGSWECDTTKEGRMFNPFSFEDYAWRVYNERLPMKDPLIRYKV